MVDEIRASLKNLGQIKKGGRLQINNYSVSPETRTSLLGFRRFLSGDSRYSSLTKVNNIIHKAFDKIDDILRSNSLDIFTKNNAPSLSELKEYHTNFRNLEFLCEDLKCAKEGIANLRETYSTDPNIVSQLEIILSNISVKIDDMEKALQKYYKKN